MQKNLILIGFMGTGKSTIAKAIAQSQQCKMIDTDEFIEESEGMSISDIFETHGEEYFRKIETQAIRDMMELPVGMVISCGGGLPLREENSVLLKELGHVVLLEADEETIWHRVRNNSNRPLLNVSNPREKIHELLEQRMPLYLKAANQRVDSTSPSIQHIIDTCLKEIEG